MTVSARELNPLPVRIPVAGEALAGCFYLPDATRAAVPLAAVLLLHGLGLTQDVLLPEVARAFAACGFASLTIDYRGWGASVPRDFVFDVRRQLQDARAAIAWLRDPNGGGAGPVAIWGYSYGAGHAVRIAAEDPRVAAVVVRAPFVSGAPYVLPLIWRDPGHLLPVLWWGLWDWGRGVRRRPPRYVLLAGPRGSGAPFPQPGSGDPYEALTKGGATWENWVAPAAFLGSAAYRPLRLAGRVRCPLAVTYGARDRIARPKPAARLAARGRATLHECLDTDHFGLVTGALGERATAREAEWLAVQFAPAADRG